MPGEPWFVALPDGEAGLAAARALRTRAAKTIAHSSGRLWLLGNWQEEQVTVARSGAVQTAVIGRCPVTAGELATRLKQVAEVTDTERAIAGLPGSFHVATSGGGRVRVRGSASAVRRIFHADVAGVTVAASRADLLAEAVGAGTDERLLALWLMSAVPVYPFQDRCVWRDVHALRPDHCLLMAEDGTARAVQWWSPPDPVIPLEEQSGAVRKALVEAVESCTAHTETVSCDLSGGLDSTSLSYLAARNARQLVTFRWADLDPGNDDAHYASFATADLPQAEHIRPRPTEVPLWFADMKRAGQLMCEPSTWTRDGSRLTNMLELVHDAGSRLHISGGGGDELFCASPSLLHDHLRSHPRDALSRIRQLVALRRVPLQPLVRDLAKRSSYSQWLADCAKSFPAPAVPATERIPLCVDWDAPMCMPPWATQEAISAVRDLLREEAADEPGPLAEQRGQHAAVQAVWAGGTGARHMHQLAGAQGVEYAAPYLDDAVVEAVLAIRLHERHSPSQFKPILGHALRGIVPEVILRRTTKGAFGSDFHAGLRRHRAELLELFHESRLARAGLVNAEAVRAAVLSLHTNTHALPLLNPTLNCEVWLRCAPAARHSSTTLPAGGAQ